MFHLIDRLIKPDEFYSDLLQIDFSSFASRGYKLVLIDIDNTLARHGAREGDDYAREATRRVLAAGLACQIISNANPRRAGQYAGSLDLPFTASARKPSTRALRTACLEHGASARETIMIGDQLLTDVAAARRAGCHAILVRPRFRHEALNVRVKRLFEKIALHRFKMHCW